MVTNRSSLQKVFLQISQNSQEKTCARDSFLTKLSLEQVFPCEFCEICKNTFFHRTSLVAASEQIISLTVLSKIILFRCNFPYKQFNYKNLLKNIMQTTKGNFVLVRIG